MCQTESAGIDACTALVEILETGKGTSAADGEIAGESEWSTAGE